MRPGRITSPGKACRRGFIAGWLLVVCSATGDDWPQYRGPNHDAISNERINTHWTGAVTNPVWLVSLTNGLTSLTVSDGRVFTQVARNLDGSAKEVCLALSVTNGAELWASPALDDAYYPGGGVGYTDDGPRTTPTVDHGSVYVLTSYLKLYRLNATNGAIIWSTNLLTGFGGSVIGWQNAASPLLEDGLLFVNANCGTSNLMAFDAASGALVWRSQGEAMTHSSPVTATIHGVRHLIFATQSGFVALDPQTGDRLWKFTFPFSYSTSLAVSPAVDGDTVFIAGAYAMGAVAVQIVQSNATLVPVQRWRNASLQSHWSTPMCSQGVLFGPFTPDNNSAQLRCINLADGTVNWSANGFGRGATLLAGTNLLAITERGDLVLAVASTNAYTELGRFNAIPNYQDAYNKCWNALALSDGQLYVRSTAYAARYDLSMPDLVMDPPRFSSDGEFQFTVRTTDGTPLDSNRVARLAVRSSTNPTLTRTLWVELTNGLVFTNGMVTVTNLDATLPQSYFMVSEPE